MTDHSITAATDGLSRRSLLIGAGVAAGAGATAARISHPTAAFATTAPAGHHAVPSVLAPIKPFLTYVGIDALAFQTYLSGSGGHGRYVDDGSGAGALTPPDRLAAALCLPAGSLIHQINVAYQGQPILEIFRRPLTTPTPPAMPFQQSLAIGGGPQTQTFDLATPIPVESDSTYSVQYYTSPGASVYGVTIGYLPPTSSFLPFTGSTPRILDTRTAGAKLAPNEERVVALGFPGVRGAVLNVTVTETEGAGFVAVNPAGIVYPGNSSLNWTASGQNVANAVITAVDATGQITLRGGANRTHVVVDRIGWLV